MKQKLLLGYDVGSSSVKASLLDADSGKLIASDYSPKQEMKIDSPQSGWAEQHPDIWWLNLVTATKNKVLDLLSSFLQISKPGVKKGTNTALKSRPFAL